MVSWVIPELVGHVGSPSSCLWDALVQLHDDRVGGARCSTDRREENAAGRTSAVGVLQSLEATAPIQEDERSSTSAARDPHIVVGGRFPHDAHRHGADVILERHDLEVDARVKGLTLHRDAQRPCARGVDLDDTGLATPIADVGELVDGPLRPVVEQLAGYCVCHEGSSYEGDAATAMPPSCAVGAAMLMTKQPLALVSQWVNPKPVQPSRITYPPAALLMFMHCVIAVPLLFVALLKMQSRISR